MQNRVPIIPNCSALLHIVQRGPYLITRQGTAHAQIECRGSKTNQPDEAVTYIPSHIVGTYRYLVRESCRVCFDT